MDTQTDVNAHDNDGATADCAGMVKPLLDAKVDVKMHDNDGQTPLDRGGAGALVKLLLARGPLSTLID